MILKISLPGKAQMKFTQRETGLFMMKQGDIHYIGGTEVLPPPLSPDEEYEMIQSLVMEEDSDARATLIEHNLRLVAHVVKKYTSSGKEMDDLISIGTIGLIKGISSYRPEKNVRLATYAARCVENEILMYFRSQRKLQGEVSLSDTLETDGGGDALYLLDVVGTDDTMLSDLQDKENCLRLRRAVAECLTAREADIIRRRYGLDGHTPHTQKQVATLYNISRSYVSRIEKRALQKLRQSLERP